MSIFVTTKSQWLQAQEKLFVFLRNPSGEQWGRGLFWSFWLSLASFPIGYGAREVLPLVCFVFLLLHYRVNWRQSVLCRLDARFLFYCLWGMGKKRVIAETGAGQHGVATAATAALMGLECTICMGEVDMERQRLNVIRMEMLGARVVAAQTGQRTLKEAVDEALGMSCLPQSGNRGRAGSSSSSGISTFCGPAAPGAT